MIGIKVATICKPPPNPSASKVINHSGVFQPLKTWRTPSTAMVCIPMSKKSMKAPPRLMLNKNSRYIITKKIGMPVQLPNTQRSTLSERVRLILPRSVTALCAIRVARSKRASASRKSKDSWVLVSTCWRSATMLGSLSCVCKASNACSREPSGCCGCKVCKTVSTCASYGISKCTVEVLGM